MKRYAYLTITCLLISLNISHLNAQGCSDSGFCTMGAYRPDQPFLGKSKIKINYIELTQHLGFTPFNDVIHSTFLDANVSFGRKTFLQVRLPAYTIIEGQLETTQGWGDIFLNLTRTVYSTENLNINVTAGAKIVTTAPATQSSDGFPIPLYRQVAYGSNDINAGFSVVTKRWVFSSGFQKALNPLENEFNHSDWEGHDLESEIVKYEESSGLVRGNDLMFRVERNIRLSKFNFYGGPLALIRVNKDKVVNDQNKLQSVAGSSGVALNFIAGAGYQFNTRMGIKLLNSVRLKDRAANPDGLNRTFISQLSYVVRF